MGGDGSQSNTIVPPPFLTKTYEMVDDPVSDSIVSWSDNNCSFVVWNVADFAKDLLPQYFKHNNFSSFVRQLNTYGFHKIDPDRWEFHNEGFSRGNKEALKNIHRRKPTASHVKENSSISCSDPLHADLEEEIRRLKHDKGIMLVELLKLREKQKTTEMDLHTVGQHLQSVEDRQQQIVRFLAHLMQKPGSFIQNTMSLTMGKKRRMLEDSGSDNSEQPTQNLSGDNDMSVSESHLINTESAFPIEGMLRQFANSNLKSADESSPLSCTSKVELWELLPAESEPCSSGRPSQSTTVSPRRHSECGDYPNQSKDFIFRSLSEHINGSGKVETRHGVYPSVYPEIGSNSTKIESGSAGDNDVFWERLLTEDPFLSDKADKGEERWFL